MKLLLTSAGLTNRAIARALFRLVGKSARKTRLAFIPTAANVEGAAHADKKWLIDDLVNIKKCGVGRIDIVDISAIPRDIWLPRLRKADVLFFGGGNTYHLMHWLRKSGLAKLLPRLLDKRVYAGISAGSIVAGPSLLPSLSRRAYSESIGRHAFSRGPGLVNFHVRPHLNSSYFPKVRAKSAFLKQLRKEVSGRVYILDDQTAVKADGTSVEVVGDGRYIVLENVGKVKSR